MGSQVEPADNVRVNYWIVFGWVSIVVPFCGKAVGGNTKNVGCSVNGQDYQDCWVFE